MIFFCWLGLFACACAFDQHTQAIVRANFEKLNALWNSHFPEGDQTRSICVENVSAEHYFYKNTTSLFALVAPEDPTGLPLAKTMVEYAETSYSTYGFQTATTLLKDTMVSVFKGDLFWDARASAMYVSATENQVEVVSAGSLWAGLYRKGVLVNSTAPLAGNDRFQDGPDGLVSTVSQKYGFRVSKLTQEWTTKPGDVMVVTWEYLQEQLGDIIGIAVETAEQSRVPISQMVSNLKSYFTIYLTRPNVLAAISF